MLELMHRIDEHYTETAFYGGRLMTATLKNRVLPELLGGGVTTFSFIIGKNVI